MKLGICVEGWLKDQLLEIEPSGDGGWIHCTDEHVSGFSNCRFDFDEDHVVDWLLEHRYSWGIYLPESICNKLKEKIDHNDEWLNRNLNWMINQIHYDKKY